MSRKAWGGRFREAPDERVDAFGCSIDTDIRMAEQDIAASMAHARMLGQTGLITAEEAETLVRELERIREEFRAGTFKLDPRHEDIHMNIEAALIERLGDTGRKLHTARSRNDQVVTDFRLWIRDAIDGLLERLRELQRAWVVLARRYQRVVIPAYTHLQPAQPVLFAHYCLAYVERFERDRNRLVDCRRRVNQLPLGAAALAGTTLPIDRELVRDELGFEALMQNSIDAVSARDFCLEYLGALVTIGVHLSGWAEEWIIWNSTSWGFLSLPDRFCTGSSIMPQKKNPDVLELTRGRTARLIGAYTTLASLLKGLPLAYNRDLQEDKPPVFEATETAEQCLELAAPLVAAACLNEDRIAEAMQEGFLEATTLMEYLIAKGVPMRTAHERIGQLVRYCEDQHKRLAELSLQELRSVSDAFEQDALALLGPEQAVRAFRSHGSTRPEYVRDRLELWAQILGL